MISLSVTSLAIEVAEGRVARGQIVIESENQVPMKGEAYSTNDRLELETQEISGIRQEIPYYFKGKLAAAGAVFSGTIVLVTNGGEYVIPYEIRVLARFVETSEGRLSEMEDFLGLYERKRKEAVELFFTPLFEKVFLKDEPEKRLLYHAFMKSRKRNLIVEEFLTAAGYKPPVHLTLPGEPITLSKETEKVELSLEGSGYLEGRIYSEQGRLCVTPEKFSGDDFTDGKLSIHIGKDSAMACGRDVLCVETVKKRLTLPVMWDEKNGKKEPGRALRFQARRARARLMHNYLDLRTGHMAFAVFAEESGQVLEELYAMTGEAEWKLYAAHLLIMREEFSEARRELLELKSDLAALAPLEQQYLLYLEALRKRTPEAIDEAVSSIRAFYEMSTHKAEALWMLIYLDREYVYNKPLQYDTIKELFAGGCASSLLCFEACEILNENPSYMEELGSFEIRLLRWGLRHGDLSLTLAYRFARLALKLKYYNRAVYAIAEQLYEAEPDARFLQVICALLIKGNRTGKEYHGYFRLAVEANVKLIGLNEFFIRSMDFSTYEEIPGRVLIYFTYSNSLDYLEKAYLYCNVLENREAYEEVYGAYYAKMLPFVEEQLLKGRINEHLAYLYTHFQKEVLEKPDHWKAVCDVLYYKKLRCDNPHMIGVYALNPETGEEKYYPFVGGESCVEIYNAHTVLCFVDSDEQRYVTGISCEIQEFLSPSQFDPDWFRRNRNNKKVLLMEAGEFADPASEAMLPVLERVVFNDDFTSAMQRWAMELLLTYYENHQDKRNLARWLEQIDYSNVRSPFRKTLMDYYMEVGMLENTFFGVELYGCDILGAAKRLRLASFGTQCYPGLNETTLALAYAAFLRKKCNKDTLGYLMRYFSGETGQLVAIWERGKRFGLDTEEFERRILEQTLFSHVDTETVFPVFLSFYADHAGDALTCRYLAYALGRELSGDGQLPPEIYLAVGREILAGRLKSFSAKIQFLQYFAQDAHREVEACEIAAHLIEALLREGIYLPVYYEFREWVTLPIEYKEMTFLTYRGKAGQSVVFVWELEETEGKESRHLLEEILPGLYVGHLHLFSKDTVHYHLDVGGREIKEEGAVAFSDFTYERKKDSRFFALEALGQAETGNPETLDYLLQAFFADQYLTLF